MGYEDIVGKKTGRIGNLCLEKVVVHCLKRIIYFLISNCFWSTLTSWIIWNNIETIEIWFVHLSTFASSMLLFFYFWQESRWSCTVWICHGTITSTCSIMINFLHSNTSIDKILMHMWLLPFHQRYICYKLLRNRSHF